MTVRQRLRRLDDAVLGQPAPREPAVADADQELITRSIALYRRRIGAYGPSPFWSEVSLAVLAMGCALAIVVTVLAGYLSQLWWFLGLGLSTVAAWRGKAAFRRR